jgi:hypothetical protein
VAEWNLTDRFCPVGDEKAEANFDDLKLLVESTCAILRRATEILNHRCLAEKEKSFLPGCTLRIELGRRVTRPNARVLVFSKQRSLVPKQSDLGGQITSAFCPQITAAPTPRVISNARPRERQTRLWLLVDFGKLRPSRDKPLVRWHPTPSVVQPPTSHRNFLFTPPFVVFATSN